MASGGEDLPWTAEPLHQYACPYLGIVDDPDTAMGYPSNANRCFAYQAANLVDHERQTDHCLSSSFSDCRLFQLATIASKENNHAFKEIRHFGQTFRVRTYSIAVMLILILLAAFIWWPPPGLSRQDRIAFSAPFERNSRDAQIEDEESAVRNEASQASSVNEKTNPPPASRDPQSTTKAEAGSEITELPALTAVSDRSGREAPSEKGESENKVSLQIAISDLPDLYQVFQIKQDGDGDDAKPGSDFSPITYSGRGVVIPLLSDGANNAETLAVYQVPDERSDRFFILSRFEPVNILGRDDDVNWLKVRTESGIEGWIRVADAALWDWVDTLPGIENDGGAGEIFSVPTSLPVINTAAARHDNLAVRSAPGAHFKRIAFVGKDRTVGLLGRWQEGPWVRIRTDDGTEGWVEIDALIPVSN